MTELSKRLRVWIMTFLLTTFFFLLAPADSSFLANPLGIYRPFTSLVLLSMKDYVLGPNSKNIVLIAGTFTAPITLYFVASGVFGFIFSVPVLAYETYRFVSPALDSDQKRWASPFVMGFTALFACGTLFGYFVISPLIVWSSLFFFGFTGATALIRVDDFYNLIFLTTLASGLSFTLPVFIVLLVKFNLIGTRLFTRNRFYMYIVVYILTGLVTPDGNPVSDILLFIPIIGLMEGALLIAKRYEKDQPPTLRRWQRTSLLRCIYCDGPIDADGVFCGHCGKSRL